MSLKLCQNIKIAEELRFASLPSCVDNEDKGRKNGENKDDRVKVAVEVALLLNLPFCPYLTWRSPCG